MELMQAFDGLLEDGCSDLLLSGGARVRVRQDGDLRDLRQDTTPLTGEDVERMLGEVLDERQRRDLVERRHVDFAFTWRGSVRIRGSAYYQRGSQAAAFRLLPLEIPTHEQLEIPRVVVEMASLHQGLILVTGPSGAGKSTTQAALVDHINRTRPCHVVTIEDPIEYVHRHRLAIVDQRQVGTDTPSFAEALRAVFREDPDVVLVGEMRDMETITSALTIAETGHLVLATMHTTDATLGVDRILDSFPPDQQHRVRAQLASSLSCIVYQQLLPEIGAGRVAAYEVLACNHAVRSLIREGRSNQLRNVAQTTGRDGSQTLEQALTRLVRQGRVSAHIAKSRSIYPEEIGA